MKENFYQVESNLLNTQFIYFSWCLEFWNQFFSANFTFHFAHSLFLKEPKEQKISVLVRYSQIHFLTYRQDTTGIQWQAWTESVNYNSMRQICHLKFQKGKKKYNLLVLHIKGNVR